MNLLRAGRIFVFEPPPGVKANMLRTFSSIPVSRICKVKTALCQPKGRPAPGFGQEPRAPANARAPTRELQAGHPFRERSERSCMRPRPQL